MKRALTLLMMAALLIAGVRFVWVASKCETGWGFVVTQWQDATLGVVGLEHAPIADREPSQQAEFWLAEVDRVVREHPESPSIRMGAAWVLDSPSMEFLKKHLMQDSFPPGLSMLGLGLDEDAIAKEKAVFREQCVSECLELAKQATESNPTDVRWWRMRALLLFEGDTLYSGQEFGPRDDRWLEVLDECRVHDPDNALYDYLAAWQLWKSSSSYDWPADSDDASPADIEDDLTLLTVHDPAEFASGVERFDRAQQLPLLAIGEAGYSAIAEFVAESRIRKPDQAAIATSRLMSFRQSVFFVRLWRWQNVRIDDAQRAGDQEKQLGLIRQNLRLYEQAIVPEETAALETLTNLGVLRESTYRAVEEFATRHSSLIESSELAAIRQREVELRVEESTILSALQNLEKETYPNKYAAIWPAMFSTVACISASMLLLAAAVFLLAARLLSKQREVGARHSLLCHAVIWIAGCALPFVVLGMAPAEMISHEAQRMAVIASVWVAAGLIAAAAVLLVVRVLRRRQYRFSLIAMLATTTAVAVLAALWPLMAVAFGAIAQNLPDLWMPAKGWSDIDAEVLRTATNVDNGSLAWATFQWIVHGGIYVGLVVSLLLEAAWFFWSSARQASQEGVSLWTQNTRARWSALSRLLGETCFWAALCFLLLYLWITPQAMQLSEAVFQHRMRYCRAPHVHWAEIRDAQAAVKDSPDEMKTIRQDILFDLYGEGTLEQDFSSE